MIAVDRVAGTRIAQQYPATARATADLLSPSTPSQTGGKGTQRKKVVAKARPGAVVEDKKLQAALKKLELSALTGSVARERAGPAHRLTS